MIEKPIDAIGVDDIRSLLDNKVSEGRSLDYKLELPGGRDEDKKEFWRDLTSFANSSGGDIVFGVQEAKDENNKNLGHPGAVLGVSVPNEDAERLRLEALIRDGADPKLPGVRLHFIPGFPRGPVVVIRVPKSWVGPHMVGTNKDTRFYARNSAGKQALDVREIRSAFLGQAELGDRIRRFRDERLGRIVSEETPVALKSGPRVTFHLVPLSSLSEPEVIDLQALPKRGLQPPTASGWHHRFNLDGFLVYNWDSQTLATSYLQVFRQGIVEVVATLREQWDGHKVYWPRQVEQLVKEDLVRTLKLLGTYERGFPCVLFVSILGVRGASLPASPLRGIDWGKYTVDRDALLLPDVILESASDVVFSSFRNTCDALWQSVGLPQSLSFDSQGNWREEFSW